MSTRRYFDVATPRCGDASMLSLKLENLKLINMVSTILVRDNHKSLGLIETVYAALPVEDESSPYGF